MINGWWKMQRVFFEGMDNSYALVDSVILNFDERYPDLINNY